MADKRKTKPDYCVVVVGAGISGLRTSITLAELGCRVLLADRMPSPGGLLRPIEKQFPSNHCGLCRMLPRIRGDEARAGCLRQGLVHERVMFYPQTEVDTISGEPGDLTVTLTSIPTGVSPELCMACGVCEDVCPAVGPDPFNAGLTTRKAIHPASPFAPSGYRVIDWDVCTRCGECVQACSVGAISLEDKPRTWDTESVALVLTTTGQTLYNPHHVDLYGGGLLPNVVTANAYERLTSSMGPFGGLSPDGLPRRPSDGQEARRIAWVQCVGSRNVTIGADYCSNACCMFAVKEAMMTRERAVSGVDTAIFYMDMRTHARDYQRYRDQAERDGVRFIRSRVHSLDATDNPHQVSIRYLDEDGRPAAEAFDLVVLSTGQAPGETNRLPAYTDHDGVLSAASSQQLMDITEAVTSADALAGEAVARMTVIGFRPQEDPDAHDAPQESPPLDDQPPKTLVAVLTNQKIVVDWAGLERGLPERTQLIRIPAKDRQSQMDAVRQGLKDTASNRLVLLTPGLDPISLAPVTLEHSMGLPDLYIEALDYSPILYRYDDPGGRAASLRLKILGAVARLSLRRAKEPETIQVEPTTLVVGAGPSGLSAALVLSQSGIRVILVDKSDRIGGTASRLVSASGRETVQGLIEAMKKDPLIDIRTGTEAVGFSGASGHYRVTLRQSSGDEETIDAGAVILAPGGGLDRTDHYLFGVHDRVVTIGQWAEELRPDSNKAQDMGDVAVILCAAARQEPHNYCSRVCCPSALETALRLKELKPECNITVFYRDVMTYGRSETLYTESRRAGIRFIPYQPDRPPQAMDEDGALIVRGFDPQLGEEVRLAPDRLVLAVGVVPNPMRDLATVFGVNLTPDGFLEEFDVKWHPQGTPHEGISICGLAKGPVRLDEAMREGRAAAARSLRLLARPQWRASRNTAYVVAGKCVNCLLCLPACPYNARSIDPLMGPIQVDPAACQSCGFCVAACPAGAAKLPDQEEEALGVVIGQVLKSM